MADTVLGGWVRGQNKVVYVKVAPLINFDLIFFDVGGRVDRLGLGRAQKDPPRQHQQNKVSLPKVPPTPLIR